MLMTIPFNRYEIDDFTFISSEAAQEVGDGPAEKVDSPDTLPSPPKKVLIYPYSSPVLMLVRMEKGRRVNTNKRRHHPHHLRNQWTWFLKMLACTRLPLKYQKSKRNPKGRD